MNYTKADMDYLVQLGRNQSEIIEIDDVQYLKCEDIVTPIGTPAPEAFELYTLQGLVDYIKSDVDGLFGGDNRYILRVDEHLTVSLHTAMHGRIMQRDCIAYSKANVPSIKFDAYMDSESFVIMLMTRFLEDENRQKLLAIASNVVCEQSLETSDDGISQRVTVKRGIVTNGEVVLKNPVFLQPMRTFVEAEQPISPFVLRIADGGKIALFEADGGAWKNEAVANIAMWLDEQLSEMSCVEVIA